MQGENSGAGPLDSVRNEPAPVVLTGIPASPGNIVAKAKVIGKNTPVESFPQGAVLVAHTTDPTLIGFMLKASAIVTEIGGQMCHTAIVAREMGIPCVVAVDSSLTTLRDGMLIRVDGSSGVVTILKPSHESAYPQ